MGAILMKKYDSGTKSATGLTGSGVRDWIVQRVSAIVLAVYSIVLFAFFVTHGDLDYDTWYGFMMSIPMRLFSIVALLTLVGHAWVGMWTIFTDYVKSSGLRLLLQSLMIIAALSYLVWGVIIFWGY